VALAAEARVLVETLLVVAQEAAAVVAKVVALAHLVRVVAVVEQ
jgi:hypothetical protein